MSEQTRSDLESAIAAHFADEYDSLTAYWAIVAGSIDSDGDNGLAIEYSHQPMPGYIATGLFTEALRVDE